MALTLVAPLGRVGAGAGGESCDKTNASDASADTIITAMTLTILEDRVIDLMHQQMPARPSLKLAVRLSSLL
jgi:hypothetical protein